MQEDTNRNCRSWHIVLVPSQLLNAQWMLLVCLIFTGCGGEGESTPRTASSQALIAAPQQVPSGSSQFAPPVMAPEASKTPPSAAADETAVPSIESANFVQISSLPHLSSLSDREKMGLLMLLPSKSSAQRLALINMYPSLATLPIQQKQVLLDRLEKIVPVTGNQR